LKQGEQGIRKEDESVTSERQRLTDEADGIQLQVQALETREAAVRKDLEDLAQSRTQFDIDQKELLEFKGSVDTRVAHAEAAEAAAAAKTEEVTAREARRAASEAARAPRESEINQGEE